MRSLLLIKSLVLSKYSKINLFAFFLHGQYLKPKVYMHFTVRNVE